MSKKVAIIISPNWRDYAEKYLAECLESLRRQDFPGEFKIFLVDNESSEESMALLKKIVETHGMRLDESGKNNPPYLQNPPTPLFERGQNPPHPPFRKGVERIMSFMMGRLLARANRIMGIFYPAYPRM